MKLFAMLFLSISFPLSAFAFPEAPHKSLNEPLPYLSPFNNDYDFNGIVALSNCSGSLVHFAGQPLTSQAYVLTNGHCLGGFGGFLKPGEVRYNKKDNRRMNVFMDINKKVRIQANLLVYATMTNTDVALFRLKQTYQELNLKGVHSFEMSSQAAPLNQEIQIISGYWRKGFQCSIENYIFELHESDWVMKDSIRYSPTGCEVYGGTSGSPIVAKDTRSVVGINNTGNESGKKCTTNNPCEVDVNGKVTVIKGRGYGQQTVWIHSCLDEEFSIDLEKAGCQLPK